MLRKPLCYSPSHFIYVCMLCRGWAGHKWAQPNVTHLRLLMRHVYTHRDEVKLKGQQARLDMIQKYSLDVMGLKLKSQFDRVLRKIGVLPPPSPEVEVDIQTAVVENREDEENVVIDAEHGFVSVTTHSTAMSGDNRGDGSSIRNSG